MTKSQAKKRIDALSSTLHRHNHLYHSLDRPEISDMEFDTLFQELIDLESQFPELKTETSPTQRVGGEPLEQFEKKAHKLPMLSLQNTYATEEIVDFDRKIRKQLETEEPLIYFCSPKFDGVAIELIYENGKLTGAITRGDGTTGENVLHNIRTIQSLPLELQGPNVPPRIDIRGEVLIFKEDFQEINRLQLENGAAPFANPRNAAAGTLRQLDSKIAGKRNLKLLCYAPGYSEGTDFKDQASFETRAANWGLPIVHAASSLQTLQAVKNKYSYSWVCEGPDEVNSYYKTIEEKRDTLPFEIDGIVVKVNDFKLQERLGFITRSPRWAFAGKFKPNQESTEILDIQIQVGRTGALTPVAIMKPVLVGGVTITHATLHNQDEIDRKDVRIGDHVWVRRAGDVIPEVIGVITTKRPKTAKPFRIPKTCPSCGENAVESPEEAVKRCINVVCPAIMKENLKHFVSRNAMNIEKLGERVVQALFEADLVRTYSDIFKVKKEDILNLERQGDKSSQNIIDSIEASKKVPFHRFLYALGIRFVGERTAKTLALHFRTVDAFLKATEEEILELDDVGPKVTQSVLESISNKNFCREVHQLLDCGITFEPLPAQNNLTGPLSDLSFVVTGTLPEPREKVHQWIESAGGKVLKSVSKKLNVLVAGEAAGSKLTKAQKLGIEIWSWDDLKKKLPEEGAL